MNLRISKLREGSFFPDSDARVGPKQAIEETLAGAAWQR